jgi:hypothetical protein
VVRAAAAYDLLSTVQGWLGAGGHPPATDDVMTLLFASLMGSIVVVWSVLSPPSWADWLRVRMASGAGCHGRERV